ncbi:C2H2 finger domain protein [Diplocarpon rosae]|nr:C2H2 finger domain protein [Diplocarpon rosae]
MVGATVTTVGGANGDTSPAEEVEYGCQLCIIHFSGCEDQRDHMRSKWHIYNLKRRMTSLPPISLSLYGKLKDTINCNSKEDLFAFQQTCMSCELQYTTQKAWQSHLKSRSHLLRVDELNSHPASLMDEKSAERDRKITFDDSEILDPLRCLFCNSVSPLLKSNISHMSHAHSFFIPDLEYLIDVESFLNYLSTVISEFHECLFCGREKPNKIAVQDHMRAKGHCKLDYEDDVLELKEFYDFAAGEDAYEYADDFRSVEIWSIVEDGTELCLSSGKILGHRSQQRNRHANRSSRAPSTSQSLCAENESQFHAPSVSNSSNERRIVSRPGTSTSIIGVPEQQQRAFMAASRGMEKLEVKGRNLYEAKVEKGGNKQKTFRVVSIGKKAGGLEKRNG